MSASPRIQDRYEDVIYDPAEAVEALEKETGWIALDLETGGLSPWLDPIAVFSFYGQKTRTSAVLHTRGNTPDFLVDFISTPGRKFVTHNGAGFDMLFLANEGVDIYGPEWYDTLIGEACTLVTNRRDVRVNLQDTLKRRLGVNIKKGMGTSPWMSLHLSDEQLKYCCEDVMLLPKLREKQLRLCAADSRAEANAFEQALAPIVVEMVMNGLPFDTHALEEYKRELEIASAEARVRLLELFGPINFNSPVQIRKAFNTVFEDEFGDEGLESTNKETMMSLVETKTSTDVEEGTVGQAAEDLLLYRMAVKRTGMYKDEWIGKYVHEGRVHARFWQVGTDTGRFSSSEPNLQQVPRTGRKIFKAPPGHSYFKVDYSQLEVVVAAVLTGDEQLLEDVRTGDVHRQLASFIFRKPPEEITDAERKSAKAATFTCIFFGSPKALVRYARMLGQKITEEEAEEVHRGFYARYRKLNAARMKARQKARFSPAVTLQLPTGLKRQLSGDSLTPQRLMNTSVQGTAAAGLKKALFLCRERGLMPYIGAVVHDEIVGCAPTEIAEEVMKGVEAAMVDGMHEILGREPGDTWDIVAEGKVGQTWAG